MKVYNPKQELPHDGTYVLIHVPHEPWHDASDPFGVFWKVAKFVRGISEEERAELSDDNPRKGRYTSGDVHGNNEVPYCWIEFGPGSFFGQDVTEWCELPTSKGYYNEN